MSGRSAVVRAKISKEADKKAQKDHHDYGQYDDRFISGYAVPPNPLPRPSFSPNTSYIALQRARRRQSVSSAGSSYGYLSPMRKPRPIIVASAIEKSDFRTHLDGMSSALRGKIGKLLRVGEGDNSNHKWRPGTATASSDSDVRSAGYPPSISAVPSLSPSTSPSEPSAHPSLNTPTSYVSRPKQSQDSIVHRIRKFEGGGKLPQLGWKSMSNNPELWDENGDTFVYMYMRGARTKPPPSFRVNSKFIEESGSKTLIDQLFNTAEPEGWPRFYPNDATAGSVSPADSMELNEDYPADLPSRMRSPMSSGVTLRPLDLSKKNIAKAPQGIQHEIYIQWPGAESGIPSTIWHITTRNFFAVLYDASALVGTTLLETFSTLFERVRMYPDYLDPNISKVAWITDYIVRHKFEDVRNNPSYAASLLAFSEMPGVNWREGYIEAFVHCAGMVNMGLQTTPEWRYVTPHTQLFLRNAGLEMEERLHRAQEFLLSFDFNDMWPATSAPPSTARGCFDRLRKWLCKYYESAFMHWPPTNEHTWLTRDMVMRLRNDFHGLYDYLVDRDAIFDGSEYRPHQKWAIVSISGQALRTDTDDLPLTDILLGFDDRHEIPHIPHPYPVVPPSAPTQHKVKSAFTLKKPTSASDTLARSRRKALDYAEASNVYTLRDQYMHTDLITSFIRFEQSDMIDTIDPFEARRGRWILIYGILQVLATISVDNPHLRYKEDVQYHLCPQMRGVVPWAGRNAPKELGSEHERSHCWTVPATWGPPAPKARPGAHKPIIWGQFGDGRSRGESAENIPQLKTRNHSSSNSTSIGRQRAEEWVATNGGSGGAADIGSDGGTTLDTMDGLREGLDSSVGNTGSGSGMTAATTLTRDGASSVEYGRGSSQGNHDEGGQAAARRRRALIHGFTDFQVPSEW